MAGPFFNGGFFGGGYYANYWAAVDDSQTINWQALSPSVVPGWAPVDDNQSGEWTPVDYLASLTFGSYADSPFADIPFTGSLTTGDNGWSLVNDTQTNNWVPV
jgi:hypothetical protein